MNLRFLLLASLHVLASVNAISPFSDTSHGAFGHYANSSLTDTADEAYGPWDSTKLLLNSEESYLAIKWKVVGDKLTLLLFSSSFGWMGFGFGEPESGSMLGADVVVVTVDPETLMVSATDRHVPWTAYPLVQGSMPFPELDLQQDWELLMGEQTDEGTFAVMDRTLDTLDPQDRIVNLENGPTAILYAHGYGPTLSYHGPDSRGVSAVDFGQPESDGLFPADADSYVDIMLPDDIQVHLPDDIQVPKDVYVQYSVDLGKTLPDVVAFDVPSVLPAGHSVHHVLIYQCDTPDDVFSSYLTPRVDLNDDIRIPGSCRPLTAWALGGNAVLFPSQAAVRGIRYLLTNFHFNFDSRKVPTTTAGMRLHTTSKRREKILSFLHMHYVTDFAEIALPPGEPQLHQVTECASRCTARNEGAIEVLSALLHMHSYGKQIWLSHYDSQDNFKGIIAKTDFWNFRFQKEFPVHAVIEPGDKIRLHCVYDTSKATEPVQWGDRSEDEMCFAALAFVAHETHQYVRFCGGFTNEYLSGQPVHCEGQPIFNGLVFEEAQDSSPCGVHDPGSFPQETTFGALPQQVELKDSLSSCPLMSGTGIAWVTVLSVTGLVLLFFTYVDIRTTVTESDAHAAPTGEPIPSIEDDEADRQHSPQVAEAGSNRSIKDVVPDDHLVHAAKAYLSENPVPFNLSMLNRFRETVKKDPHGIVCAWLDEKANVVQSFTRKQLWEKSQDLAWTLKSKYSVKAGDRVMIVYPFGIDFMVGFVAILRLGAIVVSVYPPNPHKLAIDIPKFAHFVEDSGAKTALTTAKYLRLVNTSRLAGKKWPVGITWVASNKGLSKSPGIFEDTEPSIDSLALLQYTSGSTGNPKGVMITHGNMVHQISILRRCLDVYNGTQLRKNPVISVTWTPQFHDMGLFGSFLAYLWGGTCYAMSPFTFLKDPPIWVEAMRRYGATCTNTPNFGISLTCKRLEQQGLSSMPRLSTLKFVVIGSEPGDIGILSKMERLMGIDRSAVAHMYGLAEHVLAATCGSSQTLYPDRNWSVGNLEFTKLIGEVDVCVVDPDTHVKVPEGEHGEIWVSSPCVAAGYWGLPGLSASIFRASRQDVTTHQYLRTGDLGFIRDNELFVVSRIKDLIIINGKNIAPSDVERAAEKGFPKEVRPGSSAAFQSTPESAILICELREAQSEGCTLEKLARDIIRHVCNVVDGLAVDDVILLKKGTVKKTSSGKVKRKEMQKLWESDRLSPAARAGGSAAAVAVQTAKSMEELLLAFGVKDFERTIVENGIDSMRLVELVALARQMFGIKMNYADASSLSVNDLLLGNLASADELPLQTLNAPRFSENAAEKLLPNSLIRYLRQTVVLGVVASIVLMSTMPFAIYIKYHGSYFSDHWFKNYRPGIFFILAFAVWMVFYSGCCIILKWFLVGRFRSGEFVGMWSGKFARYWTVNLLLSVWEMTVGMFVSDSPLQNIFYNMLGAKISLSARLHTPVRFWDLVSVGPRSEVKGVLYPRTINWAGAYFEKICIGSDCVIGSGSIIMAGAKIGNTVVLRSRTVVPISEVLPSESCWHGVPCTLDRSSKEDDRKENVSTVIRGAVPFLMLSVLICAWWAANELVPPPPPTNVTRPEGRDETYRTLYRMAVYHENWTWSSFRLEMSILLVYQLAGIIALGFCIALKWSFLSPYLVDRLEPFTMSVYFPYVRKTILHELWCVAFGLRMGKASAILSRNTIVAPSLAHRVSIGSRSRLFGCHLSPRPAPPGVAKNLFEWLQSSGVLKSPWTSVGSPPDIAIGDECECAGGTYLEEGVKMEDGCCTAALSHIPLNTTIPSGKVMAGNPGTLVLSMAAGSTTPSNQRSAVLVVASRAFFACLHIVYLFGSIVLVMEISREVAFLAEWEPEYTVPVILGLSYAMLVLLVLVELLFFKKIVFGRTQPGSVPLLSFRGLIFHQLQVIVMLLNSLLSPVFAGLFPLNLYYRICGGKIDMSAFVDSLCFLDIGDIDNTTVMQHAVIGEGSQVVAHRVDHGLLRQGSVLVKSGATMHPWATMMMGSLGQDAQLYPLSKTLRETDMKEGELWIGCPAVLAKPSSEARFHGDERREMTSEETGSSSSETVQEVVIVTSVVGEQGPRKRRSFYAQHV